MCACAYVLCVWEGGGINLGAQFEPGHVHVQLIDGFHSPSRKVDSLKACCCDNKY